MLDKNPKKNIFLAPMAGITDLAFREICTKFGATHTVTEMVSAKALSFGDKKSHKLCKISKFENAGLQLFGSDEENIKNAIELVLPFSPNWIDINMGCPVPKVFQNGDGSALMRSPRKIEKIVSSAVKATSLPVSVKLRSGIEGNQNAVECAMAAEAGGASFVTVHGRLREQYYSGFADRKIIGEVKNLLKIPVIANGDIDGAKSARDMMSLTGADGIMVGRATLGNPFIFREIVHFFETGEVITPPTTAEKMEVAREHIRALVGLKGEKIGILETRKHLAWYTKGLYGSAALRDKINRLETISETENLIDEIAFN